MAQQTEPGKRRLKLNVALKDEDGRTACPACGDPMFTLCPCGRCWYCCNEECGEHKNQGLACACQEGR